MAVAFAASTSAVVHDLERPCRAAGAPGQGRLQGLALRGGADPAGRLLVPALHAQLSRHAGALAHEATLFVEVPLRNGLEPQRASALEALLATGGQQAEASRLKRWKAHAKGTGAR